MKTEIKYFEFSECPYVDVEINEYARENNLEIISATCNKWGIYVIFKEI